MKTERILKRLRQFIFYIEFELDDSSYLIPVLFTGTVRLFSENNLVRASIIVCDKLSYTIPNDVSLNPEGVELLLKEHLWSGPESIQDFVKQYHLVEEF